MDKPGHDVEKFGSKMAKMSCRISGTVSAHINLYTLVFTAFIDCKVLTFQLKDIGLHELVDSNPKVMSADDII